MFMCFTYPCNILMQFLGESSYNLESWVFMNKDSLSTKICFVDYVRKADCLLKKVNVKRSRFDSHKNTQKGQGKTKL